MPSSAPPLQVSALELVRRRDLGGLTSLLADVCPLDDEDREKGNNKVVNMNNMGIENLLHEYFCIFDNLDNILHFMICG